VRAEPAVSQITIPGEGGRLLIGSDGYRLLPSASDIGFFAKYADASAIGSCAPLASPFVDGTYVPTYTIRNSTLRATEVSQYVYCSLNGGIRQVLIERSIGAPDQRWFYERAMGSTCGVHEVTYGQFSN